jgi:glycosyltransferase involved in cell wall biosynthesis
MKVVQVLPEMNAGGVERGTLEVASYLVRQGHEALVVSNGGRMVSALESAGARHTAMPVHRKSPTSLLQVSAMRKFLYHERPDIVHIRSRVPGWIVWLAWRGMNPATRPRLVSTVHGFYSVNRYSAVMTKGERVVAVSESIRDYILQQYPAVSEQKITVIHRGVCPEQFPDGFKPEDAWLDKWRVENPQLVGKRVLMLPGRITRWKGQEDFIRLISALRCGGIDAHGLIVGEVHPKKRSFEKELRTLVEHSALSSHITFLGHRNDIREVMAVSDITLSLSHDPEAFGRVSLEAMALGKPVVAYSHGGVGEQMREIFPDGIVQPGDESGLARKALVILEGGARPKSIGRFTLANMLASTLKLYEELAI